MRTPPRPTAVPGAVELAVALTHALSACGSSSPSGGSTAAAALTATEADFSIDLSSSTLTAGTYTITVHNTGSATRSLTITGPGGVDQTSDRVQGGESTTMTVALQPGRYEVHCPIADHRAMGMDTTLTVT